MQPMAMGIAPSLLNPVFSDVKSAMMADRENSYAEMQGTGGSHPHQCSTLGTTYQVLQSHHVIYVHVQLL
jgi:hypothetical protein